MTAAPALLAPIREREQAATKGPWTAEDYIDLDEDGSYDLAHVTAPDEFAPETAASGVAIGILRNDAAFIAASRTDVPRLLRALDAMMEVHEPVDAIMNPGRYERVVKVCTGCGTDDGNWQRYPCPTVAAVVAALQEGDK